MQQEEEKVTTSLMIRPSLWKQAKLYAINNDMELSELMAIALEMVLKK